MVQEIYLRNTDTMELEHLVKNDPVSVRVRRSKSTLSVCGTGIISLAGWSLVRSFMEFWFGVSYNTVSDILDLEKVFLYLVIAVTVFIVVADVVFKFYVGSRARREGKGRRQRGLYLVWAVFLLLGSVIVVYLDSYSMITGPRLDVESVATLFIDLTSAFLLVEILISAVIVRRSYRRKKAEV